MSRRRALAVVLVLAVSSCSSVVSPTTTVEQMPGAASAEAAVEGLFAALSSKDYAAAWRLTAPGQMVAVAAAEDTPLDQLMAVNGEDQQPVGENFWRGFGDSLGEFSGTGTPEVAITKATMLTVDGVEFGRVPVSLPGDAAPHRFVVRNDASGWKVDVVATFAATFATKIGRTASALGTDPTAAEVVASLRAQTPSLRAALADPLISGDAAELIRGAIEALGA